MLKEELIDEPMEISLADNPAPVNRAIEKSWSRIAPFWPLKNLIAVNPVSGFEELTFKEALTQANVYFQKREMPLKMQEVNRLTIKWLQAFFDEGQSTIGMPLRDSGLLNSALSLFRFDKQVHKNNEHKIKWLEQCPEEPEALIAEALLLLEIEEHHRELFLTLMLTTLPGWASYIQYRAGWANGPDTTQQQLVIQSEYLAFRLALTWLIWPEAKELINWHNKALIEADQHNTYNTIVSAEKAYQQALLKQICEIRPNQKKKKADAQLVFCIDVRSEPFRRAIEAQGNYETLGFAGFFGLPVSISNPVTGDSYSSCPVLLKPAYNITGIPNCDDQLCRQGNSRLQGVKKLYQSLKYTFTTPFSLVETIGAASGLWMALRSMAPAASDLIQSKLKKAVAPDYSIIPNIDAIPTRQQVAFSAGVLKMMGLTENFAPLVVFCGHGSSTENNAFATALDCGACGGRHGGLNARALATILNTKEVRIELREQGIEISNDTLFVAAEHNTTTDEVEIYAEQLPACFGESLNNLKEALRLAKNENILRRSSQMGSYTNAKRAQKAVTVRAKDWAEVRPEWGLAGNASFIVGPRWLTENINLKGRSFLHSYEWEKDPDGTSLTSILTAPVVVGQWINAQYLFSTLDNVAFGAGSKVTKNITGKIGIMQGNASDLMTGLPLQSVFRSDDVPYHTPMRLSVIVYSPRVRIERIVAQHESLQKLFANAWLHMICYDPNDQQNYRLNSDLNWVKINQTAL
ncbi:DUF2309 domain-containing protein [Mucilaginibacter sp. L3T2-6]|uniref:DUF2309 domain-containing protein n=1 Tax=Mucilaginibacter sp. L3T2-6 TaxID=3062491 RepID=UPI00267551F4|nr:DUF2309 domain-containing protein [Mucilaginibacter sp. L3T2-6]MDO3641357.1 DUF2309 domain-containing protein [Mucilaginibacter sp. L3T2-6]MDV6213882.1 DUF2309 domain-containing protein [Mucilaginibacter sp. L3T2-6]